MRTIPKDFTGLVTGSYTVRGETFDAVVEYIKGEQAFLYVPKAGMEAKTLYKQIDAGNKENVGRLFVSPKFEKFTWKDGDVEIKAQTR